MGDGIDVSELKELFRKLVEIRAFEERTAQLVRSGAVPGLAHLSTGQEAVAVGVCSALREEDVIFSGHRAHGHVLAKGCDPEATLLEILGRADGLCGGRGGSMHLVDAAHGMLGATGVVAGNLPLALGAAWAARETGREGLAAVFFGDGATGNGIFHESLNLAALWALPVLFVCENNGFAEFTGRDEHSNVALVSAFAEPYRIPSEVVDGNDVLAVLGAAREFTAAMGAEPGPRLLECQTYRMAGHYVGDAEQYRDREERARWRERDPILRLRALLVDRGCPVEELDALESAVRSEMEEVERRALAAARPDPGKALEGIYASIPVPGEG